MEGRGNRGKKEREIWRRKRGIGFRSMAVGGWKTDKDGRGKAVKRKKDGHEEEKRNEVGGTWGRRGNRKE